MADDNPFVIVRTWDEKWNISHVGFDYGDFTDEELALLGQAIMALQDRDELVRKIASVNFHGALDKDYLNRVVDACFANPKTARKS